MNYFNQKPEGEMTPQENAVRNTDDSTSACESDGAGCELASMQFKISEFLNQNDRYQKPKTHTWQSFCNEFGRHLVRSEKNGAAWSPACYPLMATRAAANVEFVSMAVIDVDGGMSVDSLLPRLTGYACLIHSSFSHTPEMHKFRVILPFAVPVPAANWPHVWHRVNQSFNRCNDPATKDASRLYFKPVHAPGAEHHFVKILAGRPLALADLPEVAMPSRAQPIHFYRKEAANSATCIEGIESSGSDLSFEQGLPEVVNRCAFMQYASAAENQPTLSEPLWMAMISNACRFENSGMWIHDASKLHGGYDENATDSKIKHALNGSAPITCNRIRELGFKGCPIGGCNKPNGEATKAPAGLMGWMFRRQLTRAETAAAQLPEEYAVGGFLVKPDGVFQQKESKNGDAIYKRLSSRIDVVSMTRDPASANWGLELQFPDPDGVLHKWGMPRELIVSAGDSLRTSLMKMGATVEPGSAAKDGLAAYLVAAMPEARALSVKQPGWFNSVFVLPNGIYGRTNEHVVFQTTDPQEGKRFSQNGSLELWQQYVALPCRDNSRAVLSICIGLAPPLLALLGEDNGGFHLRGNSSIGKSICLNLGSSVWGGNGLIRTWNMTVNGLESIATMHNDILLPLDELGQADPKAAGEAAYMLGNGQGKGRATKEGESKTAKRWRNIVLSSGERSMADMLAAAGQLVMAGQEVRMVEIPADAGRGLGVFEDIHGARSSQDFAETLKRSIAEHHGYAGPAFVEVLADPELQPKLTDKARTLMQRFVDTYVEEGSAGQVGRVARRFGLVAAAGELCIELGILPWPEGEAFDACRKCFQEWVILRGGVGNHEASQAIAQIRRFIELHGESRFTAWTEGIENNNLGKTIQRAGFRRVGADGRTEYFVFPEAYKKELCSGLSPIFVTKVLSDLGFLAKTSEGKPQVEKRMPGIGKMRVYHLTADLMGVGASQAAKEEAAVIQGRTSASSTKYIV